MKRNALVLALLLFSLVGYAQVNHLKFLGFSIDGTQQSFDAKLPAKGFRKVVWKGMTMWEGSYHNEPVRLQTAIGPRTGKTAFVFMLSQKECSGQTILNEIEKWKSKIANLYNTSFYVQEGFYRAEVNSSLGSGAIGVDCIQVEAGQERYVVRISFVDGENIGK